MENLAFIGSHSINGCRHAHRMDECRPVSGFCMILSGPHQQQDLNGITPRRWLMHVCNPGLFSRSGKANLAMNLWMTRKALRSRRFAVIRVSAPGAAVKRDKQGTAVQSGGSPHGDQNRPLPPCSNNPDQAIRNTSGQCSISSRQFPQLYESDALPRGTRLDAIG